MKQTTTHRILISLLACIPAACGGGGGKAVSTPNVQFPPADSLTDANAITVRGTVANPGRVAGVFVGDTPAASNDDWQTWSVDVPLDLGENQLQVTLHNADGDEIGESDSVSVLRQTTTLGDLEGVAMDPVFDRAWWVDADRQRLVKFDLVQGTRSSRNIFSDFLDFEKIDKPRESVYDQVRKVLFVADHKRIQSINVSSGQRRKISDAGLWLIQDIDYHPVRDEIVSLEFRTDFINFFYRTRLIDPDTGASQIACSWTSQSANSIPAHRITFFGPQAALVASKDALRMLQFGVDVLLPMDDLASSALVDMIWDPANIRFWLLDRWKGLFSFDLFSEVSTLELSFEEGVGEVISDASDIALGNQGDEIIITADTQDAVYRWNRLSNELELVADSNIGGGPPIDVMTEQASQGTERWAVDYKQDRLFKIDPENGQRTLVAQADLISMPTAVLPHGDGVYVACRFPGRIVSVDAEGHQSLVAEDDQLSGLRDLVQSGGEGALYALTSDTLLVVDPVSGEVQVLSEGGDALGADFSNATDLVLSQTESGAAFMTTVEFAGSDGQVFLVNLEAGSRIQMAGAQIGNGVPVGRPQGAAHDGSENVIFVAAGAEGPGEMRIYSIRGDNLLRTDVSSKDRGRGPLMDLPGNLELDPMTGNLYMAGQTEGALLVIDPISGDRVITSR